MAKIMVTTNGKMHLSRDSRRQACGMGARQRYELLELAASFRVSDYPAETHGYLYCLKCQMLPEWAAAYAALTGAARKES